MEKNFKNDLEYGQIGELKVAEYFNNKGYETKLNEPVKGVKLTYEMLEELRGWDLKVFNNDKIIKVEVKRDQKSKYTGNVAIEQRCVNHSNSDVFVYIFDADCNEMYFIKYKTMKYILTDEVEGWWCLGGDGKRSKMKIIRKDLFLSYAKKLK